MSLAFVREVQRTCNYCKCTGHNQPNCQRVKERTLYILAQISDILSRGVLLTTERQLLSFLEMLSVQELCFIIKNIRGLDGYIRILLINNSITEAQSKMRYKKDRVLVIMWLYYYSRNAANNNRQVQQQPQQQPQNNKKIVGKTLEIVTDLTEFECPICVTCLPAKEKVETGCKHCVCKSCLVTYMEHKINNMDFSKPRCVMCRADIDEVTFTNPEYLVEVSEMLSVM